MTKSTRTKYSEINLKLL